MILPSWLDIAATRSQEPFTPQQRDWQLIRRGRYLVRGTRMCNIVIYRGLIARYRMCAASLTLTASHSKRQLKTVAYLAGNWLV